MKTIDKFMLKSYLGPMILTFFIVMFILMMNFVWRYIDDLVGKGLDVSVIIELMLYASATMIPMGLPLATLLAGIMTMGNLGENYELLALKSCGMSLPRIMRPLLIVVFVVAVGSFFVANNLVPHSWMKMNTILMDIRRMKQTIEFQDGVFFNDIEDMTIRVEKQDPKTHLLTGVLIYDTRSRSGNMVTTMADSGYIRLSDDKKFLLVTLNHGQMYETTRSPHNNNWYDDNMLRHSTFERQSSAIPLEGFSMERSSGNMFSGSQSMTIAELGRGIDSLDNIVKINAGRTYEPLLRSMLPKDQSLMGVLDTTKVDYSYKKADNLLDSIARQDVRRQQSYVETAKTIANNSRNSMSFDEDVSKETLNQLYRNQSEWHRKISLPFSIIIFFLIGAPLGAIIRRGGLGMPVVVSVLFFVLYYVISIAGEKLAKEGSWPSFSGMWLSAFILTPIAIYLTYKATNDSNLFNVDWYRAMADKLKIYIHHKLKGNVERKSAQQHRRGH